MRFSHIQIYHFSIFQDMANRLITIICYWTFFKIRQIGLLYIPSTPTLPQHFLSTYLLLPYYIIFYYYYYYYYLLPVYIISAGVLRFYKNADSQKLFLFFLLSPSPSLKFPLIWLILQHSQNFPYLVLFTYHFHLIFISSEVSAEVMTIQPPFRKNFKTNDYFFLVKTYLRIN